MKFRGMFEMAHAGLYATRHMQNSLGGWETELPRGPETSDSEDTYKYYWISIDPLEKEDNSGFTYESKEKITKTEGIEVSL